MVHVFVNAIIITTHLYKITFTCRDRVFTPLPGFLGTGFGGGALLDILHKLTR